MKEIFERVSIRRYNDQPVEDEKVEMILKAAMAAPSAMNRQPWEFVVVRNRDILNELGETTPYSTPVLNSRLTIAVLANTEGYNSNIYLHDMGAVCENILLETTHLGLGAVWMAVAPSEERMKKVRNILNIPDYVIPFAMISIGYPADNPEPKKKFKPEKIHYEKY